MGFEPGRLTLRGARRLAFGKQPQALCLGRETVLSGGGEGPFGVRLPHREAQSAPLLRLVLTRGARPRFERVDLRSFRPTWQLPGNQQVGLRRRSVGVLAHQADGRIVEGRGRRDTRLRQGHRLGARGQRGMCRIQGGEEFGFGDDGWILSATGRGEDHRQHAGQGKAMHADSYSGRGFRLETSRAASRESEQQGAVSRKQRWRRSASPCIVPLHGSFVHPRRRGRGGEDQRQKHARPGGRRLAVEFGVVFVIRSLEIVVVPVGHGLDQFGELMRVAVCTVVVTRSEMEPEPERADARCQPRQEKGQREELCRSTYHGGMLSERRVTVKTAGSGCLHPTTAARWSSRAVGPP